jgi:DNA mismatch repair ATPase MutS
MVWASRSVSFSTPTCAAAYRHLSLDDRALLTLEVLEGSLGGAEGSLLQLLDRTASLPGRRRVRAWLCRCGGVDRGLRAVGGCLP